MVMRSILSFVAAVSLCAAVGAQTKTAAPAQPKAASSKPYVPPRTSWGDPDLQGNYTNKYEQGTPFERPAEFDGKKLVDITPAELSDIVKRRQQRAIDNAPFLSGNPTGTIAGP